MELILIIYAGGFIYFTIHLALWVPVQEEVEDLKDYPIWLACVIIATAVLITAASWPVALWRKW